MDTGMFTPISRVQHGIFSDGPGFPGDRIPISAAERAMDEAVPSSVHDLENAVMGLPRISCGACWRLANFMRLPLMKAARADRILRLERGRILAPEGKGQANPVPLFPS
jgi:hypothetical protein